MPTGAGLGAMAAWTSVVAPPRSITTTSARVAPSAPVASRRVARSTASGVGMMTASWNSSARLRPLPRMTWRMNSSWIAARAGSMSRRPMAGSTLATVLTRLVGASISATAAAASRLQATTTGLSIRAAATASAFSKTCARCPPSVPPENKTISGCASSRAATARSSSRPESCSTMRAPALSAACRAAASVYSGTRPIAATLKPPPALDAARRRTILGLSGTWARARSRASR